MYVGWHCILRAGRWLRVTVHGAGFVQCALAVSLVVCRGVYYTEFYYTLVCVCPNPYHILSVQSHLGAPIYYRVYCISFAHYPALSYCTVGNYLYSLATRWFR
jgi:hypothetical protein